MNWGVKLAVALAIFIIGIVFAGVYMVTQNHDSLEEGDYYEKGLNYDDTYQRKQNVLVDKMQPLLTLKGDSLHVQFQEKGNKGEFLFKRPSNQDLDTKFPFQIEGDSFSMSLATFERGSWNLSISWENNNTSYLFQEVIRLK